MKRNQIRKSLVITSMLLLPTIATFTTLENEPVYASSEAVSFKDIKGHWAEKTINGAVSKGYISGYDDGSFKPDKKVTNAEFIKMLTVALNPQKHLEVKSGGDWYKPYMDVAKELGLVKGSELSAVNNNMIRLDLAKLGARAIGQDTTDNKKWMYIATSNGLINGVDNKGTLKETGTMTRAQAATLIERVLQVRNGEKLVVDNLAVKQAEKLWKSFSDSIGHWAEKTINAAVAKGYVSGYDDGSFKPEKKVTNAEFVKMLTIALNPNTNYEVISGGNWHQPYINAAKATGLIKGSELSAVNNNMTRLDLAKLGARAIGQDTTDDKKWMYIATSKGLINGVDNKGTLKETGTMTRAQAVTLIERVLQVKNGEKLAVDKYAVSNAEILWHKTNIFTMAPQWFKPNKINDINMSDSALTSKVENGNVISKTNKLIAIDLDDPKDPYRYLLNDKKLYSYDAVNDKKNYYDISKTKNGYVFLSLNELTIQNTSTITQTVINGAYATVNLQSLDNEYLPFTKGVVKKDGTSSLIGIKKGQTQKQFEYSMGVFISKDFKMTEGRGVTVYFNGLINWGGNNSGGLYMDFNN